MQRAATTGNPRLHWTGSLASELTRSQSNRLQDLGANTRKRLPDSGTNIDNQKQRLTCVWAELKQSVVDKAIEQWRPRLRACVRAKGHHFEQQLLH